MTKCPFKVKALLKCQLYIENMKCFKNYDEIIDISLLNFFYTSIKCVKQTEDDG